MPKQCIPDPAASQGRRSQTGRPAPGLMLARGWHALADRSAITQQPDTDTDLAQLSQDRGLGVERGDIAARQSQHSSSARATARAVAEGSPVSGPVLGIPPLEAKACPWQARWVAGWGARCLAGLAGRWLGLGGGLPRRRPAVRLRR